MATFLHPFVMRRLYLAACLLLLFLALTPFARAITSFEQWIEDFYPTAAQEGITRATYDLAFQGVTEPDAEVLRKAAYQPEFTVEIWDYLDTRVTPLAIKNGQRLAAEHAATLKGIEQRTGVPSQILLAIWSMESAYGNILERPGLLHYVPRALATLAQGDPKRAQFARSQLIAALRILQKGDIGKQQLWGSWAGAMGHTQFIPTSYLAYGVDMDMDGNCDIWASVPDALGTAANLLHKNGWQPGRGWGFEVQSNADPAPYREQEKTLAQWQDLGFRRVNGAPFTDLQEKAILKLPAGATGPAFLMLKNFFVIKRYNNSDSYALAVALLADRIAGLPGLVHPWPRPAGSLSNEEKIELQQLLLQHAYYQGAIDGNLGTETRNAIRRFQQASNMPEDGEPTRQVLQALRK